MFSSVGPRRKRLGKTNSLKGGGLNQLVACFMLEDASEALEKHVRHALEPGRLISFSEGP